MNRDEILALSDTDLVRHVAEQVMRWTSNMIPLRDGESYSTLWCPLSNSDVGWGHTAMVWEAMRAKGFGRFAIEYESGFRPIVMFAHNKQQICEEIRCEQGNERRAILQTALIAVNAKS